MCALEAIYNMPQDANVHHLAVTMLRTGMKKWKLGYGLNNL